MDSMRNFIKINLFLNKSKRSKMSHSHLLLFAMLNRKRRNVNGKMRNIRQLRRTFLLLNTLFVLSVFRENRWTKSALLFGCWLIVFIWTAVVDLSWGRKRLADTFEAVVLLRGSSPNSRHIDCIFFVFV